MIGVVPIRNLVIAPPDRTLDEMMIADPVKADVFMDQEEAARLAARYELLALLIVDEGGRLEGIITVDDVIDIINEESTEDMYRMIGLAEEDRVFTPVGRSVRMRLPWTIVNLLTATLAASVVGFFEHTLQEIIALVTFMPVVASIGGNGATKTATAMIFNLGLMAGFAGAVIPLLLKALKFDPALGSGIVVTGLPTRSVSCRSSAWRRCFAAI